MKSFESIVTIKAARIASFHPVRPETVNNQRLLPTGDMVIKLDGGGERVVSRDWFGQAMPAAGGYLVELEDGKVGYMPKLIFEAIFPVEKEEPVSTIIDV